MKFNPFKPNQIISPGMFAGRLEELQEFDKAFFQTCNGNPHHFLIHGERGIGKSSLLLLAQRTAVGGVAGINSKRMYKFVTVNVEVDPSLDYGTLVRKVATKIKKEVDKIEVAKSWATSTLTFLSKCEAGGIKFNRDTPSDEASELNDQLCEDIAAICERLGDQIDGVAVLIDEADNASPHAHLGEFVKLFTEKLTKLGCNRVLLGMSGISNVIEKLRDSHPSSLRVLNQIILEPLLDEERKEVIRLGLNEANEKSSEKITITPEAEDWIAKFSEGFPHFIQQYASSAFDTDNNNEIDLKDVMHGAFKDNGALDQLGVRYFKEMYSDQINSDEYRKVLQAMAVHPDKYCSPKDIGERTSLKKTTLGNALRALKDRGIILAHPEKQGLYKLPSDSFALWIRMRAKRDESDEKAF